MVKKREELVEEYTEKLLEDVGRKIIAKRLDVVGELEEELELTEEERLAYEYVLTKVERKLQKLGYARYFDNDFEDVTKTAGELGISRRTYYNQRKELLNNTNDYLTAKGFGYNNASNVDRYDLPDRLSLGKYIKWGNDFVYEEPEDGDYHEIYNGAEGLVRYKIIRVVKSLEILKLLTDNVGEELEQLPYIEEIIEVDDFGIGLMVVVDRNKYEDYMDDGYVLNHLEVELVEVLGDERATELLQQDAIFKFK